eukprot:3571961-Prymnesium_polylepis.1
MSSSRFDRGSGFGTRARATMACNETFLPSTLLLSSWQAIAADGLSSGRALKAKSGPDPRNH